MFELQLRAVVAARKLEVAERGTAAADRGVGAGDPDAVDLDAALNGADAKGHIFLSLNFLADGLGLEHFGGLDLLALLDRGVLLDAVLVKLQFDQANDDGYDLQESAMAAGGVRDESYNAAGEDLSED